MEGVQATEAVWTTADYALIVSICSAGLSLMSFVWGIWSKFIYPRGKVRAKLLVSPDPKSDFFRVGSGFVIEAVNLGPGDVVLRGPVVPTRTSGHRKLSVVDYWKIDFTPRIEQPGGWAYTSGGAAIAEDCDWPRRLAPGEIVVTHISCEAVKVAFENAGISLGVSDSTDRFFPLPRNAQAKVRKLLKDIDQ